MSINPIQSSWLTKDSPKTSSLVGRDVLGYCNRCQLNLMHTIITVGKDNKPDRGQCRTCKSEHKFKPPKKDAELKANQRSGGNQMAEHDEELDLDQVDVSRVFQGDDSLKKKPKGKAKGKKTKGDDVSTPSKNQTTIPLSMQMGTSEDLALFENKLSALKAASLQVKDYNATIRFGVGEVMNHKTFGTGFVVAENGRNKIEVLFKDGRKLLVTAPKA